MQSEIAGAAVGRQGSSQTVRAIKSGDLPVSITGYWRD